MVLDADLESIQEVRHLLAKAEQAQKIIQKMTQEQVDNIVHKMAQAAKNESGRLAALAVEETGYGKEEDKLTKNLFAARDIYESIRDKKTVGILKDDTENKVIEVAEPVGIVAGIIPSTNPTSTAIFKALISVKGRNAIIMSPHPQAAKSTKEAVDILAKAASDAGAPEGLISCISTPTVAGANELMKHEKTDVILATGGSAMVRAAYSSGKPAYGVGPGNVPVYIHESANVALAAKNVVESKSFDWGTICASEQSVVVDKKVKRKFKEELEKNGAYFVDDYEKKRMEMLIMKNGSLNPAIVGKSPAKLAEMAGIVIPENSTVIVAEEENVGKEYPFSIEKLSPILAFYTVDNEEEAIEKCQNILKLGGEGHTVGIHAENEEVVKNFGLIQKAYRVAVNTGTTFGAIGSTTNINPSLTLGCGSVGNNITSDNITVDHLINIKRIAYGVKEVEIPTNYTNIANKVGKTIIHNYSEQTVSEAEIASIVRAVLKELDY